MEAAISAVRTRIRVFCSYSHKDSPLREQLDEHLAALRRNEIIEYWHDRKIASGSDWRTNIATELEAADCILLLVSPSFINSDFCYTNELKRALERQKAGEAIVIPIALRPCDWTGTPLAELQALPQDARPVTTWSNRDRALLDVANGIRRAIEGLASYRARNLDKDLPPSQGAELSPLKQATDEPRISMGRVLERVFRRQPFASVEWMREGLSRAAAVARIESLDDTPVGTGFLVDSRDFALTVPAEQLLLTCSYIVGPSVDNPAIDVAEAVAFFELLGVRRNLGTIVWSSPPSALRASLITLSEPVQVSPCSISSNQELANSIDSPIFLIGHPRGGPLQFSIWNNEWLDYEEPFLHYRAATEPGSSGSPVFDVHWRIIGVHSGKSPDMQRLHGNPGTYWACEGVSARSIREALSTAPGHAGEAES